MAQTIRKTLPKQEFENWFMEKARHDPVFYKMYKLRPQFDNDNSFMHFVIMTLSDMLTELQSKYIDHMLHCCEVTIEK